ncbi:MAG TPA: hypothetical protein QGH28_06585 [Chloroflexota bacterium]|nr:hypothetical protein [Chloroflexota bacterium]
MDRTKISFMRQYRTPSSEGYLVRLAGTAIGRLDLHFGVESSYATLILLAEHDEAEALDLICEIDEQLVVSAETSREEFYVTVYQGHETGFYSDEHIDEHRSRRPAEGNGSS